MAQMSDDERCDGMAQTGMAVVCNGEDLNGVAAAEHRNEWTRTDKQRNSTEKIGVAMA